MKIAVFTDVFLNANGGIPISIDSFVTELRANGHEVVVICPDWQKNDGETIVVPTCKLFRPGGSPWAKFPKKVARWLKKNHPELSDYDVFHAHHEGCVSIAAMLLGKEWNIPVVQTIHGQEDAGLKAFIPTIFQNPISTIFNKAHKLALKEIPQTRGRAISPEGKMRELMARQANAANLVITPSLGWKKTLLSYGVETNIKILPTGIPDEYFTTLLKRPRIRRLTDKKLKILWHSRVSCEKGMIDFLQAIANLPASYRKQIKIVAYGDGNVLKQAKRLANKKKLKIRWHGPAGRATIFRAGLTCQLGVCMSNNYDTQALTLTEDEAMGLPVLIRDSSLSSVVPKDGQFLCENPSIEAITNSLKYILDNPEEIAEKSRVMLKKRSEVKTSVLTKKLEKLYQSLKSAAVADSND